MALSVKDLWCQVVWSPADGPAKRAFYVSTLIMCISMKVIEDKRQANSLLPLLDCLQLCCQPEIT